MQHSYNLDESLKVVVCMILCICAAVEIRAKRVRDCSMCDTMEV
jgi:hypothetical protein